MVLLHTLTVAANALTCRGAGTVYSEFKVNADPMGRQDSGRYGFSGGGDTAENAGIEPTPRCACLRWRVHCYGGACAWQCVLRSFGT